MKSKLLVLLLFVSSPAMAVQHWLHEYGRAHTTALGVAVTTGNDAPDPSWTAIVKSAVNGWAINTDVDPFIQTLGYQYITVYQDPAKWKPDCEDGLACATIYGKKGGTRRCFINLSTRADGKPSAHKKVIILHEIGHCYGLGHNDPNYLDGRDHENPIISQKEIMHPSGCPALNHACGVTRQAKDVINRAY